MSQKFEINYLHGEEASEGTTWEAEIYCPHSIELEGDTEQEAKQDAIETLLSGEFDITITLNEVRQQD